MFVNPLPRLAKRDVLAVSFVPIIALAVFVFIGLIRFLIYKDSKTVSAAPTTIPTQPPRERERALRAEEPEIENPPPPPYQPDKLPPYPAAPAPAYVREGRA